MAKDDSLFTSLDQTVEINIYVVDDFSLNITGCSDVLYQHGRIFYVYHVPNISPKLLSISQLTRKIV
jgi:hypothetical protein